MNAEPLASLGRASNGDFSEKGNALAADEPIAVAAIALAIEALVPTPIFAAHQSMNGEPRCGVPIDVRDKGVYVVGLRWEIRYRTSKPPIEWATKLTPVPFGKCSLRYWCICSARSWIEPVLFISSERQ